MFELVSRYHPDKICDYISDYLTDCYVEADKDSHIAIETMLCGKNIFLCGEVSSEADIDVVNRVEEVENALASLGFNPEEYSITDNIRLQSDEIKKGVDSGGAGDQGFVFGFATYSPDTNYLPSEIFRAQKVMDEVCLYRDIFTGDAKIQVTDDSITFSACHLPCDIRDVREIMKKILRHCGFDTENNRLYLNPAGAWTYGGSDADTGLTGRKIVCDAYGGFCPVGGGALSGKDLTKVDRSGAYFARIIAKYFAKEVKKPVYTRLAFAIGVPEIISLDAWMYDYTMPEKYIRLDTEICKVSVPEMIENVKDRLKGISFSTLAQGNHMLWI